MCGMPEYFDILCNVIYVYVQMNKMNTVLGSLILIRALQFLARSRQWVMWCNLFMQYGLFPSLWPLLSGHQLVFIINRYNRAASITRSDK